MWGMAHRGGTLVVSREGWTAVWQVGVVWEEVVCSRGGNHLGKGLGAWSRTLYVEYIPESRRRPAVSFKLGFDAFFRDTPVCALMLSSDFFPPLRFLLMKLGSLFLRGVGTSGQLCGHATIFVQGSAMAAIGSLKAFGPDASLMIGESGKIFGF